MQLFMNDVCGFGRSGMIPTMNGSKVAPTEMAAILLTGPMDLTYRDPHPDKTSLFEH